jgi:hypothetical protein
MSKYSVVVSGNVTNQYLCTVNKKREFLYWEATLIAAGSSFGSGTLTWRMSPDKGVTWIDMQDESGSSVTATANSNFTVRLGGGSTNSDNLQVGFSVAGSTNPSFTVYAFDNNN